MAQSNIEYLKSITGPKILLKGVGKERLPKLNIGKGLTVTTDLNAQKHTLKADTTSFIFNETTSSVGGVEFVSVDNPRFAEHSYISQSQQIGLSASLNSSGSYYEGTSRAIVKDTDNSTYFTRKLGWFASVPVSGANPQLEFTRIIEDELSPTDVSMSIGFVIAGSNQYLVTHLTSSNTSSLPYMISAEANKVSF